VVDPRITKELFGPPVPARREPSIGHDVTGPTVVEHGASGIDPSYSAKASGWFQLGGTWLSVRCGRVTEARRVRYARRHEVRGPAADDGVGRAVHVPPRHGNALTGSYASGIRAERHPDRCLVAAGVGTPVRYPCPAGA
jgi:hypothetical protein